MIDLGWELGGRKKKEDEIKSAQSDKRRTQTKSKNNEGTKQRGKIASEKPKPRKCKKGKEDKKVENEQILTKGEEEGKQLNKLQKILELSLKEDSDQEGKYNISQKPSSQAMSQRPPSEFMEEYECKLQRLREEVLREENWDIDQIEQKLQDDEGSSEEMSFAKVLHAYKNKLELGAEGTSSVSDSLQENSTPSEEDISRVLSLLQNSFPEKSIAKLLQRLYNCLILKTPQGKTVRYIEQPLLPQPSVGSMEVQLQMPKLSHNKRHVTKRYIRHPEQTQRFRSEEEEIRFTEKKLVASAFVNRDYGIAGVEEQVSKTGGKVMIERTRYKTLASTVATDAYRKLEEFLIRECHRGIKQLNRQEIRSIVTVLLNCRRNFQAEDCSTFFKFMKIVYGIGSVTITEDAAIRLYINVQKTLKARMAQIQMQRLYDTMRCNKQFKARRSFQSERFQLHKIWTNELEEELLRLYKRDMQLVRIRDHFKQKYPQHQHLFTIDSLRSRFHKILRVALRKVKCFCEKFGPQRVPGLITLNDLKVKFVLRSPEAMNARLLLVDMYLNDQCDIKRLYNTVSAVNDFIIMKDTQRMSEIIEAEPQIKFATEKSNHNVAATKSRNKEGGRSQKDDVFLKEKEQNFDHFVQVQNGRSLHYYKMSSGDKGERRKVKLEEANLKMQPTEDKQSSRDKSAQSQPYSKHSDVSPMSSTSSNRAAFETIIKQQLQKYMRSRSSQSLSVYSI